MSDENKERILQLTSVVETETSGDIAPDNEKDVQDVECIPVAQIELVREATRSLATAEAEILLPHRFSTLDIVATSNVSGNVSYEDDVPLVWVTMHLKMWRQRVFLSNSCGSDRFHLEHADCVHPRCIISDMYGTSRRFRGRRDVYAQGWTRAVARVALSGSLHALHHVTPLTTISRA